MGSSSQYGLSREMGFRRTLFKFTVAKILMTINIVVDRYDLATGMSKELVYYQMKMRWSGNRTEKVLQYDLTSPSR